MKNTNSVALEKQYILSKFKVFEYRHHLNNKVYQNRGVLKDAERFSLVDTVLDGEYNDLFIPEEKNNNKGYRFKKLSKQVKRAFSWLYYGISGILFKAVLVMRLATYYILHFRYRPL